jgi:alkyl hydroperoxide reductase subunit D
MSIDTLKDRLPDYARDLKLNLSSLASEQLLTPQQKAGSFIAAALAANHAPTTQAVVGAFAGELTPEALNAVKIAAALMAMNNIYYRFVHLVHADDYKTLPAKLRMTAMAKPGVDKVDFELWSLVVSAVNVPRESREGPARPRPFGRADPGRRTNRGDRACGGAHPRGRGGADPGARPSGVVAGGCGQSSVTTAGRADFLSPRGSIVDRADNPSQDDVPVQQAGRAGPASADAAPAGESRPPLDLQ